MSTNMRSTASEINIVRSIIKEYKDMDRGFTYKDILRIEPDYVKSPSKTLSVLARYGEIKTIDIIGRVKVYKCTNYLRSFNFDKPEVDSTQNTFNEIRNFKNYELYPEWMQIKLPTNMVIKGKTVHRFN